MGQRVIRINQHKPDGGMWDLADFLNVIENEGEQWNWMIMVVDEDGITFSSPRDFDCALVLTYPEMVHFARGIFQTTSGLFLGDSDPEKLYA